MLNLKVLNKISILFFSFCFYCAVVGQRSTEASIILDSLNKSISYKTTPREVIRISEKLLTIGEKEKDTFLILRALHHLGRRNQFANENHKSIAYFNRELLFFTEKKLSKKIKEELKNTEIAPVEIYAQLGNNFSSLGDYKKGLEFYNISKDIAEKENLEFYKAVIPVLIANINVSIKNYTKAIENFKTGLFRLENSTTIDDKTKLFNSALTVTQLATTHLLNNNIDSAKIVLKNWFKKDYDKSSSTIGLSYKNVEAAILVKENKLSEAISKYKEIKERAIVLDSTKAILYYYNGYSNALAKNGEFKKAAFILEEGVNELKKEVKEYSLAENYKQLAKYYKKFGAIEKSNEYFEKYVLCQSAIEKNKTGVVKILHDKELENVTKIKEHQKKLSFYYIIASLIIISFLLFFLVKSIIKRKKDSAKFNLLINKIQTVEKQNVVIDTKDKKLDEKNSTDINPDTYNDILSGLNKLEQQHYYLKKECNSYNVAKKINTNTSYLSKVINAHHQKNFNTYINDLRINYAILKIKEDSKFRRYSIQGISEELGYKSPDSFTKYFKRRTGLLPSIYIKKIKSIS